MPRYARHLCCNIFPPHVIISLSHFKSHDNPIFSISETCIEKGRYKGHDIENGIIKNVETAEECQTECKDNIQCYFWTFDPKICYLQNANATQDKEDEAGCPLCQRGPDFCPKGKQSLLY